MITKKKLQQFLEEMRQRSTGWQFEFHPSLVWGVQPTMIFMRDGLKVLFTDDGERGLHGSVSRADRLSPTDEDVERMRELLFPGAVTEFKGWQGAGTQPVAHLYCRDPYKKVDQ